MPIKNLLNEQFQSVFFYESVPEKGTSPHPIINKFNITTTGLKKLLNEINPHQATGPGNICGKLLKDMHMHHLFSVSYLQYHMYLEIHLATSNMQMSPRLQKKK